MRTRGRALAGVAAGVFAFALILGSFAAPLVAQQRDPRQQPKLDKTQLAEAQAITAAVDSAQYGDPVPADIPVTLEGYHFFKSANGQTYVPFTVTVDPKGLGNPNVTLAVRLVKKGAVAEVPKEQPKKPAEVTSMADRPVNDIRDLRDLSEEDRAKAAAEKNKRPPLPTASYNDLDFVAVKAPDATQPAKLTRAFQAAPGDYDVYIGVKERNPSDKKVKAKITVLKQAITLPDYQGANLVTSSLIVTDKINQLPAPLSSEQQRANPYTIGLLQIVPKAGTKFASTDELNVYFQVYNTGLDAAKKPDLLQEFTFFQKQGTGEKTIGSSEPVVLNATTLPAAFDPAKHQLQGGGGWPLTTFKPGDYRLEIKITDKISGKKLTQSVNFTVS